jgi:hypothetical protein
MPKFHILYHQAGGEMIEADTFVDAGHEGQWIDFRAESNGQVVTVFRVSARNVKTITRSD